MENLKLSKNNKILIIAAHPDDEMLGCGGSIVKLKEKNQISVVFLTNGVSARTKSKKAANIRKITAKVNPNFLLEGRGIPLISLFLIIDSRF